MAAGTRQRRVTASPQDRENPIAGPFRVVCQDKPIGEFEGLGSLHAAGKVFDKNKCQNPVQWNGARLCWCCRLERKNERGNWKSMDGGH